MLSKLWKNRRFGLVATYAFLFGLILAITPFSVPMRFCGGPNNCSIAFYSVFSGMALGYLFFPPIMGLMMIVNLILVVIRLFCPKKIRMVSFGFTIAVACLTGVYLIEIMFSWYYWLYFLVPVLVILLNAIGIVFNSLDAFEKK